MRPIRTRVTQMVVAACAALSLCLWSSGPAFAQSTGFEAFQGYTASPAGVVLTGQQGWFNPVPATSSDHLVFTYKNNALGLPKRNSIRNGQFIGARALGDGTFPRAQANFNWSSASQWVISYDVAVRFGGTLPAFDNLSSFSLQDSVTARFFIALNRWQDVTTAANWRADYNVFNAAGVATNMLSAGPAWENLQVGRWYRQSTMINFTQNRIIWVGLMDLTTGAYVEAMPADWYLNGGQNPTQPLPTALRFFVGGLDGTVAGNITAYDNPSFVPMAGPLPEQPPQKGELIVPRPVPVVADN